VSNQNTASDTTEPAAAEASEPKFIDLALASGQTKRVQVRMPTETQQIWFEATVHRFTLAMDAWNQGAQFDEGERGELYNDILEAVNVFVANLNDRKWISTAMARGTLEFSAVLEGIDAATRVLDLQAGIGPGSADVVVE
jgi:hypothetical protein